ncbi:hypothetical protein BGX21_010883 [Mortierella sp. AD011]|nr:hypothetical protein BGX20_000451 [Mortierella sp. AD010]KAF9402218.1 hypothetical protein BGX21_010883 [Mortierella sp. AD011]
MNERLRDELMMENNLDSEMSGVLKCYVPGDIIKSFLTPVGPGPIAGSKAGHQRQTTTVTVAQYSWSENRHKSDMKLVHDPREDYDSYLREVQKVFPDQDAVLPVFGDDLTTKIGHVPTSTANDVKYRLNLAAEQEALYQLQLKLRHLLENGKPHIVDGDTIGSIESNLQSFEADPEARLSMRQLTGMP